jgi:hypothetical protein
VWFSRLFKVARHFYFENSAKICDWLTTETENSVVVVSGFHANADFYYRISLFLFVQVRDNAQLLSVILTIHYIIFCFTGGPVWFSRLLKVGRQFYFENSAKICDWLTTKNEKSVVVVSGFRVNVDFYYKN